MREIEFDGSLETWTAAARAALNGGLSPAEIVWANTRVSQSQWFETLPLVGETKPSQFRVPKRFLELARLVSCHRDERRWALLYGLLWRLTHGEPHVLEISTDPEVYALIKMEKAVHHDVHKMRAFVRFREVQHNHEPWFLAWYQPDHYVLPENAAFFRDRFYAMSWSILTPDECLHWDRQTLRFSAGVSRSAAPNEDEVEDLWRTYYKSTFNPARLKVATMTQHMPRRFWQDLPETQDISAMIAESPQQVQSMITADQERRPRETTEGIKIPTTDSLPVLAKAAAACRACPLWQNATCTVFGEGPQEAKILVVGEQPGDQEDLAGKPFIGPAGKLLNRAFEAAGIRREELYLTNAVKHFKWTPRGKRRLHAKPNAREIAACRPWLEAEIRIIKPTLIVCLGATAAHTVTGEDIQVTKHRGEQIMTEFNVPALITLHPSALLRMADEGERQREFDAFVKDLRQMRSI